MLTPDRILTVEQKFGLRDHHGAHRFEDSAMEIVTAIKRHYSPALDTNDGGQILAWLTAFADEVYATAKGSVGGET